MSRQAWIRLVGVSAFKHDYRLGARRIDTKVTAARPEKQIE
jgi:hypothetical protein